MQRLEVLLRRKPQLPIPTLTHTLPKFWSLKFESIFHSASKGNPKGDISRRKRKILITQYIGTEGWLLSSDHDSSLLVLEHGSFTIRWAVGPGLELWGPNSLTKWRVFWKSEIMPSATATTWVDLGEDHAAWSWSEGESPAACRAAQESTRHAKRATGNWSLVRDGG